MKKLPNENYVYLNAFQTAIEQYWEIKSSAGTNAAFNYNSLGNSGPKSFNPRMVRMLPIDYVCDIEVAARRVISSSGPMAEHFKRYYIDAEDDSQVRQEEQWQQIDYRIRLKVGKEIYRTKLHNLAQYMRPVWVKIT